MWRLGSTSWRAPSVTPKRCVGIAQMRGHALLERGRRHVLEEASVFHAPEIAGVRADEEIGLGRIALGADALKQLLGAARQRAHTDACRFLKRRIELTIGVIMAGRIDIDVVGVRACPVLGIILSAGGEGG